MESQTQAAAPAESMPPLNVWLLPVLAGWIVPGAGHFMLKKTGRGALLFAAVLLMFLFGLSMSGMMFTPEKGADLLTSVINYGGFVCNLAAGGMYLLATMFGYSQPDMPGDVHDYGTKFLVTAGLLNILAMVDAYEIAAGKKD
jgi:TM2 domain-containing membrane protein YozV